MTAFAAALQFTLKEEGPFSDDPRDPGGATYKGITLAEFRRYIGNPNATVADLLAITDAQVTDIYMGYWLAVRGEQLPDGVNLSTFDMAVNCGSVSSVKLLQRTVGAVADGIVGPHTLSAITASGPLRALADLYGMQKAYYEQLGGFPDFGDGWLNRCAARLQMAFTLIPVAT
jgi:lysozyme family protein